MWRSVRNWRRGGALAVAACAIAAVAALTGWTSPKSAGAEARAGSVAVSPNSERLELGRKVYNFRCYFCHGYSGDARTLATTYLERKPADFSSMALESRPRDAMLAVVRDGRAGTAMAGFTGIITPNEMEAVTDFVRHEFMQNKAENTRYHTAENNWPNHERHRDAFPFARGEIAIDTPWDQLNPQQQRGKRLFMTACITCHDHGRVNEAGAVWESRPLSFPRDAYCTSCHQDTPRSKPQGASHPQRPATHTFSNDDGSVPVRRPRDAQSRVASGYLVHDQRPELRNPTPLEARGETLFHRNCAFCHAGDGTSKGWIGSFLEPHPRDLTSPTQMRGMTRERLVHSISEGLPGTSMPAFKSVLEAGDIEALIAYISRVFHPVQGVRAAS